MWPFKPKKPTTQRRLDVRRGKPVEPGVWDRFRAAGGVSASLVAVALFAAVLLLDTTPLEPTPYRPGGYLAEDVFARVSFPPSESERDRHIASLAGPDGFIDEGTLLATQTVERGLRDHEYALLVAEHRFWQMRQNTRRPWRRAMMLLGRAGVVAAVILLLGMYVHKYQPRVMRNLWRCVAIAGLVVLVLALTKVMVGWLGLNPYFSVLGVFLAASILAIAYDQRFAFALSGALVVLTALQIRAGLGELLALWAAAAATVFQLRDVRSRSKLLETGAVTAAVTLAAVGLVEAAGGVPWRFMLVDAGYAVLAAVAGGFLAQGILPLVERIFRITTSMTLLEWCDASNPLLRRMEREARGTYSHSLLLGTMCEAAAEAIGANGLLARVGAYYHDVGKVHKPDYFVENQQGPDSKHDKLSPAMSLLLIKGHVKDGLEMAKEYGLPRQLHEFIASHHGTTLVEYFYHAAAERHREAGEDAPEEIDFRYGGPRPRSKEAAILMLADAAESAVRAMPEPTPGRIEDRVHEVVVKRLNDGQLDDCEMTLREAHAIEASFIKSLCAIHHARVSYPKKKARDAKAANGRNGRNRPAEPTEQAEQPATQPRPAEPTEQAEQPATQPPPAEPARDWNGRR
jgi:hypothetical protein